MSSEDEKFHPRVSKKKPTVISSSEDSDSDINVTMRKHTSVGRSCVSDGEVDSTECKNSDKECRRQNWSDGDEQGENDESSSGSDNEFSDEGANSASDNADYSDEESASDDDDDEPGQAGPDLDDKSGNDSDSFSDGESEKCPICLSRFKGQEVGTPESCDHNFCVECILEWAKKVRTCPVDRQSFTLVLVREKPGGIIIRRIPISKSDLELFDDGFVEDQTICEICGQGDREDRLLLCDGCDHGYHCDCLTPPLDTVPIEEWYCPDCAPQHNQPSVSDEEGLGIGRSNRRLASSVQPIIRRIIARTRASETVRARVRHTRGTQNNCPTTSSIAAIRRSSTTKKLRKRRTVKRRKTTRTVKRRKKKTSKSKSASTKRKSAARSGSTKKRRWKVSRKKSSKKYVKIPSIRKRIADKLGICKSKGPKHTMPLIKRPKNVAATDSGFGSSFSLFGEREDSTNYEQYNSSDSENSYQVGDGGSVGLFRSAQARTSHARLLVKRGLLSIKSKPADTIKQRLAANDTNSSRRVNGLSCGPVDILGSILHDQSALHSSGNSVASTSDGSLKPKNVGFSSGSKYGRQCAASNASTPKGSNANSGGSSQKRSPPSQSTSSVRTTSVAGSSSSISNVSGNEQGSAESTGLYPVNSCLENVGNANANKSEKIQKKVTKVGDECEEDVDLYDSIDIGSDFDGRETAASLRNEDDDVVEPAYSPVIDPSDVSDEDLVIDESKIKSNVDESVNEDDRVNNEVNPTSSEKHGRTKSNSSGIRSESLPEVTSEECSISNNDSEKYAHLDKGANVSRRDVNTNYSIERFDDSEINVDVPSTNNEIMVVGDEVSNAETKPSNGKISFRISSKRNIVKGDRSISVDKMEVENVTEDENDDDENDKSDSDVDPVILPLDIDDFQLCKDYVHSPPPGDHTGANPNIQDMCSPISATGSLTKDSNCGEEDKESETKDDSPSVESKDDEDDLIIREKMHPTDAPNAKSVVTNVCENDDDSNVNWKKLSKSTKVRSYRDGKPKNTQTYFQHRDIKKKLREINVDNTNTISIHSSSTSSKRDNQGETKESKSCHHRKDNSRKRSSRSSSRSNRRRREREPSPDTTSRSRKKRDRSRDKSRSTRQSPVTHQPVAEKSRENRDKDHDKKRHCRHRHHHHHHKNRDSAQCVDPDKHTQSIESRKKKRRASETVNDSHRGDLKRNKPCVVVTNDEPLPPRSKRRRSKVDGKEVIASGDSITVKVNFSKRSTSRSPYNQGQSKEIAEEKRYSSVSNSDSELKNDEKRYSSVSNSESETKNGKGQDHVEDEIIILSSPSSSSVCTIYTIEDSDAEITHEVIVDENDVESSSENQKDVEPVREIRKVVLDDSSATDQSDDPSRLRIVLSTEEADLGTSSLTKPETEKGNKSEGKKPISADDVYDPFEPTHSPQTPENGIMSMTAVPLPPLPDQLPLPPEPPEEVNESLIAESIDNSIHKGNASVISSVAQGDNLSSTHWPMQAPHTLPPDLMFGANPPPRNLIPPPPKIFNRPPPPLLASSIRIIPPTVLPSANQAVINPPPASMIRSIPPPRFNMPPPSINPNVTVNRNVATTDVPHKNLLFAEMEPEQPDNFPSPDVTDVVDMELDNSPVSTTENDKQSTSKKQSQSIQSNVIDSSAPLTLTNDVKIDSLLLSLVTNKQILNTLANKGKSLPGSSSGRNKASRFSTERKVGVSEKKKHLPKKSLRKTGPRTPESDSNEPALPKSPIRMNRYGGNNDAKSSRHKHVGSNKQFAMRSVSDHKKGVVVKLGEDSLRLMDEVPGSAVELQVKEKFLKKLNRQERVIEEVKLALKPYYHKRDIDKDDYKEIMRKAVPKICHNKSGEINPLKVKSLIECYVKKCKHEQRKKRINLLS